MGIEWNAAVVERCAGVVQQRTEDNPRYSGAG